MADILIQAEQLCVSYGDRHVLNNVNFEVNKGQVFALLGGNGAGKSTTLKTFLGLAQPQSGQALVLGKNVVEHGHYVRQKIAYLPESVMLYAHLTAVENINYFLALAGICCSTNEVNHALERVSLQQAFWHKPLGEFSKGMRQKTAIALALLRQAPILFLDEPTSGLDPAAIDEFNSLVSQLAEDGSTIFMVTHDVYGACQVADQIGLLRHGQLVGSFSKQQGQRIDTEAVHAAFIEGPRA